MNAMINEIGARLGEAIAAGDKSEAAVLHAAYEAAWVDLIASWGISPTNAKATWKIHHRLNALSKRDEVAAELAATITAGGKAPRHDLVKAVADVHMSRAKWSPERLRHLAEGPRVYAALAALRGLEMGVEAGRGNPKTILKAMVEIGAARRAGAFRGVAGHVKEAANLEWWRAQ